MPWTLRETDRLPAWALMPPLTTCMTDTLTTHRSMCAQTHTHACTHIHTHFHKQCW
jgi:hypothetical protein